MLQKWQADLHITAFEFAFHMVQEMQEHVCGILFVLEVYTGIASLLKYLGVMPLLEGTVTPFALHNQERNFH